MGNFKHLIWLAYKSLMSRKVTALLTIFAISLSVTLYLSVEKLRRGAQEGFSSTISGSDLLVGARSGDVNLLLYAIFRIGNPSNNIKWETYQKIAARKEVAWTVPISLGDAHKGFRVIGTTEDYFKYYAYGQKQKLSFAEGKDFAGTLGGVFGAVIGAKAAEKLKINLGDEISLAHGTRKISFHKHDENPFRVTGILNPTGTPTDQGIFVSLEGLEAVHLDWGRGFRRPASQKRSRAEIIAMDLTPKSITAFLVGMKSRVQTLKFRRMVQKYKAEPLSAVIPGMALMELWKLVGTAAAALGAVAAFVIFVGLIGLLINIMTSLNERRREMAVLRSVGARPAHIFSLLVMEASGLAAAGAFLGILMTQGIFIFGASYLSSKMGVFAGGAGFTLLDVYVFGVVVIAAAIFALIPAIVAYKRSVADGLTLHV